MTPWQQAKALAASPALLLAVVAVLLPFLWPLLLIVLPVGGLVYLSSSSRQTEQQAAQPGENGQAKVGPALAILSLLLILLLGLFDNRGWKGSSGAGLCLPWRSPSSLCLLLCLYILLLLCLCSIDRSSTLCLQ